MIIDVKPTEIEPTGSLNIIGSYVFKYSVSFENVSVIFNRGQILRFRPGETASSFLEKMNKDNQDRISDMLLVLEKNRKRLYDGSTVSFDWEQSSIPGNTVKEKKKWFKEKIDARKSAGEIKLYRYRLVDKEK